MTDKPTVLGYIHDQTRVLENVLDNRETFEKPFVELFNNRIKKILFFGSGTSYNASIIASYYFKHIVGIDAEYHYPTVFENYEKGDWTGTLDNDEMLFFGISQSGTSISTINVMKYAKENGHQTIALTEDLNSEITKHVDRKVHLLCEKEMTPPETRGYTVTMLQLYLMAIAAAFKIGKIDNKRYQELLQDANELVTAFDQAVNESELWYDRNATNLVNSDRIYVLGYGIDYATAIEGQLKIGEMLRLPALGYEIEEYSHGPTMAISPKQSIIIIGSDEREWDRMLQFRKAFLKYTPRVSVITMKNFDNTDKDLVFSVKSNKFLAPLIHTIPLHLIAARGAKDTDIDTGINPFKEQLAHLKEE